MVRKIRKITATAQIFGRVNNEVFKMPSSSDTENEVKYLSDAVRIVSICSALGAKSVLDCPDTLQKFHRKFGLPNVSMSTIHNRIKMDGAENARKCSYGFARMLQKEKLTRIRLKNDFLPTPTVLHCDGSRVMTHYGVAGTFGGRINHTVDFEICERGAQEIEASLKIVQRAKEHGINVDIVTNDGIAYSYDYFEELGRLGIYYFIRLRGDDERNLCVIRHFEDALRLREIKHQEVRKFTITHDDIMFTVRQLVDIHPVTQKPVLIARIDSTPVGKKLQRLESKEKKRKHKDDEFYYEWEEDPEWERMSEYAMTHYIETNALFLTPQDVLTIMIDHWTIETHWRKVKRSYWSRNSYKKDPEGAVVLFVSVSIGIAMTEAVKYGVLLVDLFVGIDVVENVLRMRFTAEKQWTLLRVRRYVNEVARSKYFCVN